MTTQRKAVPQKPKARKAAPKKAAAPRTRRKVDPRHSPDRGFIPSDNPRQGQTY